MKTREFSEIENHYFAKANDKYHEAEMHKKMRNYDLVVRSAQESHELYLKAILLHLKIEHRRIHDVTKEMYQAADMILEKLKEYNVSPDVIAGLVLSNRTLTLWRTLALYGDEKLKVIDLFGLEEAKLALDYALIAQTIFLLLITDKIKRE